MPFPRRYPFYTYILRILAKYAFLRSDGPSHAPRMNIHLSSQLKRSQTSLTKVKGPGSLNHKAGIRLNMYAGGGDCNSIGLPPDGIYVYME